MKGIRIYNYTLLRSLGKGGMAEVWYAENNLGIPAAIKIMLPQFLGQRQVADRFETEAKAMVQLNHPNIRKVLDYGEYEGLPFIIMEYLEGEDLGQLMVKRSRHSEKDLEQWWRQSLSALAHTHEKSIIHRDIKPSNIFLQKNGQIKILDFGIAKIKDEISHTRTGQGLGTVLYMSPEQISDPKRVSPSTDIYSLGMTIASLLRGEPALDLTEDNSTFNIQLKITKGDINLSGINDVWRARLLPALKITAEERPAALDLLNVSKIDGKDTIAMPSTEKTQLIKDDPMTKDSHPFFEEPSAADIPTEQTINDKKRLWFLAGIAAILIVGAIFWVKRHHDIQELPLVEEKSTEAPLNNKVSTTEVLIDTLKARESIQKEANSSPEDAHQKVKKEHLSNRTYDSQEDFEDGLAKVEINGKYGFINKQGIEIIPLKYDYIKGFSHGLCGVQYNGRWGFIDRTGAVIIPFKYSYVGFFCNDGTVVVELNGVGIIDRSGKTIIPLKYDNADCFSEGLAWVAMNGKYGYIDKSGKIVIPFKYDRTGYFSEGLASVQIDGMRGYIDRTGKLIVPVVYDNAFPFTNGTAEVSQNGKTFFINKLGQCIKDCP